MGSVFPNPSTNVSPESESESVVFIDMIMGEISCLFFNETALIQKHGAGEKGGKH